MNVDGSTSILCAGCESPSYVASSPTSSLKARPMQRSGRAAISDTVARMALRSAGFNSTISPFFRRACVHRSMTRSGAPLTKSLLAPAPAALGGRVRLGELRGFFPDETASPAGTGAKPQRVDMDLRSRENSRVAWCGKSFIQCSFAAEHASAGSVGLGTPSRPIFSTSTLSAASVGSPTRSYLVSAALYRMTAWLQSAQTLATSASSAGVNVPLSSPWGAYDVPVTASSVSLPAFVSG